MVESTGYTTMGTVTCDECKVEFIIRHEPAFNNKEIAEKQSKALQEILAEDHRLKQVHKDIVDLKWP